jgi:hypothetical protein
VLAAFGFIALATVRWDAWVGSFVIQTTDDAYVRAETTQLSSRVSGAVLVVTVKDFQRVKAGDLLIQIDPADYVAVVDQAEASVIAAQATFDNVANQTTMSPTRSSCNTPPLRKPRRSKCRQTPRRLKPSWSRSGRSRWNRPTPAHGKSLSRPPPPTLARRPMSRPAAP